MAAAITDVFIKVGSPGNATSLSSPGHTVAGTTFNVISTALWPSDTAVIFGVDVVTIVAGVEVRTAGTYTVWRGLVTSATSITGSVLMYGTDQNYAAGSTTRVYILPTSSRENRLIDGILTEHTQTGNHKNITTDTLTATGTVTAASFVTSGGAGSSGWTVGLGAPNTITALGNRSYSCVFNATDLTGIVSAGMRLRTQRTVPAPNQSTSLNGTTQFYSKASPNGMTFTNNFVASAWVKLSSYAQSNIASRYNGTSGWYFDINSSGQVRLIGANAGAVNVNYVQSYQSLPLNKWVHMAAQLDMSTVGVSTTTSYVMIDGLDVPASKITGGTNPTALIQAGNLEIGTKNAVEFFPGKIAQVAIYSAKVTQATILASMNQTLTGTETSLISAYSFNNSINDLNANANNLTANGSAVATNTDSPFGGQADGTISTTLDYGIIQKTAFSTNTTLTVQVPEGCTIPTSGGVSAASYSSQKTPFNFPAQRGKWVLEYSPNNGAFTAATVNSGTTLGMHAFTLPIGEWTFNFHLTPYGDAGAGNYDNLRQAGISTVNNGFSDYALVSLARASITTTGINSFFYLPLTKTGTLSASLATVYYVCVYITGASGNIQLNGASGAKSDYVRIEPAHL